MEGPLLGQRDVEDHREQTDHGRDDDRGDRGGDQRRTDGVARGEDAQPTAAATAYSDPTCMIATGSPMITSRRMPPPTAAQTPTNTAGTREAERQRFGGAEGAEQADDHRIEGDDHRVEALEDVGQQHADEEAPTAVSRYQLL
jgi:hypothetical protein